MNNKEIKIWYTNADVLRNKMNEATERVNIEEPDIILINEVKPKSETAAIPKEAEFKIDEKKYQIYSNNLDNENGRGQVMHINRKLQRARLEISKSTKEIMLFKITLTHQESLLIALVYRSPSSSERNNNRIIEALEEICKTREKCIIVLGDFNYKEINWELGKGKGQDQEDLIKWGERNYMHQHIKETTRQRGDDRPSRYSQMTSS